MTPEQASELLGRIAVIDGRTYTAAHAVMWSELLTLDNGEPISLRDAVQATMHYHREATYPIKPADIIQRVKAIRRARIGEDPAPIPPVDPNDTVAYLDWVRAWAKARGDGADPEMAVAVANHQTGITAVTAGPARQVPALPEMPRP